MNIKVCYNEIIVFVEKNYNQKIAVAKVDGNSLEVYYKPARFIPQVTIKINIESIDKDCIRLAYEGSLGVPKLINAAVKVFKEAIPSGVQVDTDNRTVKVSPYEIKELEKLFAYVALDDVAFTDSAIEIRLQLA